MACTTVIIRGSAAEKRAASILRQRIAERCPVEFRARSRTGLELTLETDPHIGGEGYRIEDESHGAIRIAGADSASLLAGIGRFLRDARYGSDGITPGPWRGISRPAKKIRGIYFATHFHNYYHDAPEAEVARYIEDLALWGFNTLNVWFDMHHYRGFSDPAAKAMIKRLRGTLKAARRVGMRTSMAVLGNEAFADSPAELRADPETQRAHYRVELCPSKPGAQALMLRWFEKEFRTFAGIAPDYLWIWPYDQGGCACPRCRPWGANGFLRMGRRIAPLFRRYSPKGKIILSTWLFDYGKPQGEWKGLARSIGRDRSWIDYIMADAHELKFPRYVLENGVPGGLPLLNFPEISMYGMSPWGGFGANPQPSGLQRLWDSMGGMVAGGFPYSEGIFEDINKAIMAQFYWGNRPAVETAREYIAYEFDPEVVEPVMEAIGIFEANQCRMWEGGDYSRPLTRCKMPTDRGANRALALVRRADAALTPRARTSWRWRLLLLRGLIDDSMFRTGGVPPPECEPWFEELVRIYHANQAEHAVHPPTRSERLNGAER